MYCGRMRLESTWTRPSRWCPSPHCWTAPDDQGTEHEVSELVAALVRALQPEIVVETGTHLGQTAQYIGRALLDNGHGTLHTLEVDPDLHSSASSRVAGLPVVCHLASSMEFEPPGPIDFAWFDSLLHLRWPEFVRFWPRMHERTVVGFHDTATQHGPWSGVIFENEEWLDAIDLPTPRGVTLGRVRPDGKRLRDIL